MSIPADWYERARQLACSQPPNYPEAIRLLKLALHAPTTDRHGQRLAAQTLELYHDKMRQLDDADLKDPELLFQEGQRWFTLAEREFSKGNAFGARTFVKKALGFLDPELPNYTEANFLLSACEKELQ